MREATGKVGETVLREVEFSRLWRNPTTDRSKGRRKKRPEDATPENLLVAPAGVSASGEVVALRGMIRFGPGSLEVCGIIDEIMAGILGTEGTRGNARLRLKKNFFYHGKWQT